jgi:hypothetical protein
MILRRYIRAHSPVNLCIQRYRYQGRIRWAKVRVICSRPVVPSARLCLGHYYWFQRHFSLTYGNWPKFKVSGTKTLIPRRTASDWDWLQSHPSQTGISFHVKCPLLWFRFNQNLNIATNVGKTSWYHVTLNPFSDSRVVTFGQTTWRRKYAHFCKFYLRTRLKIECEDVDWIRLA